MSCAKNDIPIIIYKITIEFFLQTDNKTAFRFLSTQMLSVISSSKMAYA